MKVPKTTPERSLIMAAVRQKNTGAEMIVRKLLFGLGLRYRLHRKDLPGSPDVVLPKHGTVIFVHGCFWHRHPECRRATSPKSNEEFWQEKFARNIERDKSNEKQLALLGWRVVIVWECETRSRELLRQRLADLFPKQSLHAP